MPFVQRQSTSLNHEPSGWLGSGQAEGRWRPTRYSNMKTLRFISPGVAFAVLALAASTRAEIKLSASEPVLLTSAGQSADVQILKTLLDRSKVTVKVLPLAKASDLEGAKTLVVAVGGSAKGLGAAGIDAPKETARLKALLARATELKIPVITMHIGGESKRGDLSDGLFALVVAVSSQVVILKDGDKDGFLSKTAVASKVPLENVDRLAGVIGPIKTIFGKQ